MPNEQGSSEPRDRADTATHGASREDAGASGDVAPSDVDSGERARSDDTRPGAATWVGRWRLVYAIAVLILGASIVPVPAVGVAQSESASASTLSPTLVFHLSGYAALAVSLVRVQPVERQHVFAAAVAIGVAVAVGFGIELLQTLVPWRRFAWIDSVANVTGACVGVVVHAVTRARTYASR
jgi:VanZ family protein